MARIWVQMLQKQNSVACVIPFASRVLAGTGRHASRSLNPFEQPPHPPWIELSCESESINSTYSRGAVTLGSRCLSRRCQFLNSLPLPRTQNTRISAFQSISTLKLITRGFSGEYLRVPPEEHESQGLPFKSFTANEGPVEDTLLLLPGFLSADQEMEQLFISDTNHHRVIVVDGSGKILDCIGSCPGFEDGTFEQARLYHPSSTVFDQLHDCLYIADSKNHVIRRANMIKRRVDTLGRGVEDQESPVWSRFLKWIRGVMLGTRKDQQLEEDTVVAESNSVLKNPCHLKLASDGSLLVASHEFESLWVLYPNSGQCSRLPYEGSLAVYEEFKRRSDAPDVTSDTFSLIQPATADRYGMVSRVASIANKIFYLDAEDHIVRKMDLQTGSTSTLQLSNFGCLGIPAWWSIHPLSMLNVDCRENGSTAHSTLEEEIMTCKEEIQVQPGRCLLCIEPILPKGTTLVAPVENSSVWRQARGSVVELSTFGGKLHSHKVSGAQQWVDDFEDLETDSENFEELVGPLQSEYGLPLYSFIDASLGSGEVLVDAVLYVKPVNSGSRQLSCGESSARVERSHGGINSSAAENRRSEEDRLRLRKLHARVKVERPVNQDGEDAHHQSSSECCGVAEA
ncbi:hypothetical protein R1flu_025323 [Riccia fluitans]|uniref:NHL domain-containing protein n=1 Tax=Riccia fluitans TaxID=41844 RepID=A0ABD1Y0G3_9MARC